VRGLSSNRDILALLALAPSSAPNGSSSRSSVVVAAAAAAADGESDRNEVVKSTLDRMPFSVFPVLLLPLRPIRSIDEANLSESCEWDRDVDAPDDDWRRPNSVWYMLASEEGASRCASVLCPCESVQNLFFGDFLPEY
jgi:hypothetical protein